MKKHQGIILILIGVGLLSISILFSSGRATSRQLNLIQNISRMDLVLKEGKFILGTGATFSEQFDNGHWGEVRIAIPLKYLLSLSVVLILLGTGIVLILKDKETNS